MTACENPRQGVTGRRDDDRGGRARVWVTALLLACVVVSSTARAATPPAFSPAQTDANVATLSGYDGLAASAWSRRPAS